MLSSYGRRRFFETSFAKTAVHPLEGMGAVQSTANSPKALLLRRKHETGCECASQNLQTPPGRLPLMSHLRDTFHPVDDGGEVSCVSLTPPLQHPNPPEEFLCVLCSLCHRIRVDTPAVESPFSFSSSFRVARQEDGRYPSFLRPSTAPFTSCGLPWIARVGSSTNSPVGSQCKKSNGPNVCFDRRPLRYSPVVRFAD